MEIRHHQFDRLAVARAPLNQDARRLAEWGTWLDRLWGNVYDLLISRQGFREAAEVLIKAEASVLARTTLGVAYQSFVAIKLRCQLDLKPPSVSIARLLKDMRKHPHLISREVFILRFMSLWDNRTLPTGEKLLLGSERAKRTDMLRWQQEGYWRYDQLVGLGQQDVTDEQLKQDLSTLNQRANRVQRYANKRVAHNDSKGPNIAPSGGSAEEWFAFLEVDPCIELLRSLFVKYWWLIKSSPPVGRCFEDAIV